MIKDEAKISKTPATIRILSDMYSKVEGKQEC